MVSIRKKTLKSSLRAIRAFVSPNCSKLPRNRKSHKKEIYNLKHYVYIITNKRDGVLYIGLTKDLKRRIYQHKNKAHPNTISSRYNLNKLVYFEEFKIEEQAKKKERQMKKWNRDWKIELIEKVNPDWRDFYDNL